MSPKRIVSLLMIAGCAGLAAESLPEPAALVGQALPDPLVMRSGMVVKTKEQWLTSRAPELRRLFEFYEYGVMPAKPQKFEARVVRVDPQAFAGKATLKQIEITCASPAATIAVLLVVPNGRSTPVPCFVGMNFHGNHALVADPLVPAPVGSVAAKEDRRGKEIEAWAIEQTIERGYAFAGFFSGDVVPDDADVAKERLKDFLPAGKPPQDGDAPAVLGCWAWGFSRVVDFLKSTAEIGPVMLVGHSRNGKAALLAAAMDERVAMVIPSQAGCGGTSPCRLAPELAALQSNGRPLAETVAVITNKFPHWFCGNFRAFSEAVEKLPFDQHALVALCAPRPVLFSCATEDVWSNPAGQFEMLRAADPVYRLLCGEGCNATQMPPAGTLSAGRLGFFIRPGKHSMNATDWKAWLDFADSWKGKL